MLNDLRFAVRLLRKDFALTVMATLTLALGIGGTTTMFSAVHATLIRPLPYAHPDQLMMVYATQPLVNPSPLSAPDFLDWKSQAKSFSHLSPIDYSRGYNLSDGDTATRVSGMGVSADFFSMLGAKPVLGRRFVEEDEQLGRAPVVILSERLWRSHFGADPDIVGRSISLDGEPHEVIGVIDLDLHPRDPERTDLWLPFRYNPKTWMGMRGNHWLLAIGRLKDGVSQAQAEAEISAIAKVNAEKYPNDAHVGARLIPLREQLYGAKRATLVLILAAAALLLLIACVNVANLLLSRSQKRKNEIAVRLALGATPARVVRQLLLESSLLGAVGTIAGVLLALWSTDALNGISFFDLAQAGGAVVDLPVLLATVTLTVVVSIFFGLAPAIDAARTDLQSVLKEAAGRSSQNHGRRNIGRVLVVAELGLALVLLAACGLTMLNLDRLRKVDLGFDAHGILTFRLSLPDRRYDNDAKLSRFYRSAEEKIAALPGVTSIGLINSLPIGPHDTNGSFEIEGREPWADGKEPLCEFLAITPDYFSAAKVAFVLGRNFTAAEDKPEAGVTIINETMAKAYWPNASPLGARLAILDQSLEIIGVVKTTKRWSLDEPPVNELYLPLADWAQTQMSFMVRTAIPPGALVTAVERAIASIDSTLPLYEVRTGEEHVGEAEALAEGRLLTGFLALFALVALLLAAIGVYGVVSYQLSQRRPEIAIRLALGGAPKQIQSLLLRETVLVVALASAVGATGTLIVERLMSSVLFGASWRDLWITPVICIFLGAIALLATLIPARRSTNIDPNAVLRYE